MDFFKRRGDAHGDVHYCSKSTDDNACHKQTSQIYINRIIVIFQLKEWFRIFQPETIYFGKELHCQSKDHRQKSTGNRPEKCADGFAMYPAKDRKAHKCDICAHKKCRENGRSTLKKERNQYCKQAKDPKGNGVYKCENPGNCPGQALKYMNIKKAGATEILISNCSDCTNTVMGSAPGLGLNVHHATDHIFETVGMPVQRHLTKSKFVEGPIP